MPQLSLETYVSQYFWFLVILFFFYLFVYVIVLPKVSFSIKLRKKLTLNNDSFSIDKQELDSDLISSEDVKRFNKFSTESISTDVENLQKENSQISLRIQKNLVNSQKAWLNK